MVVIRFKKITQKMQKTCHLPRRPGAAKGLPLFSFVVSVPRASWEGCGWRGVAGRVSGGGAGGGG